MRTVNSSSARDFILQRTQPQIIEQLYFHHQVIEKEEKNKQLYNTTQQNKKHRQTFTHIA